VQVDPIKTTLTAPGTERLKLECDEPLSNFAFNFNLRRYNKVLTDKQRRRAAVQVVSARCRSPHVIGCC